VGKDQARRHPKIGDFRKVAAVTAKEALERVVVSSGGAYLAKGVNDQRVVRSVMRRRGFDACRALFVSGSREERRKERERQREELCQV
jgi:hypothetical protein